MARAYLAPLDLARDVNNRTSYIPLPLMAASVELERYCVMSSGDCVPCGGRNKTKRPSFALAGFSHFFVRRLYRAPSSGFRDPSDP
jgi:hypothetical protein